MGFQSGKHDLTWLGLIEAVTASIDAPLAVALLLGTIAVLLSAGDPLTWIEAIHVTVSPSELFQAFQRRVVGMVTARYAEGRLAKRFGLRVQSTLILWLQGETHGPIVETEVWKICTSRIFRLIDHLREGVSVVKNVIPQPARANVAS
ncbi:hydrogenase-1 operon protein HyaE [Bradyrhizobium macuxiense]|uniref:Hydrogenase-1 operon protein HyaE n=1 Tax=Bradyrhizobium macuxiense TaxID=1755647 RepID=A0A560L1E2_9BRAD|nr:hydrogenase accessory protein [Bradyrhizobium macuxiense]TWB89361.1 hydrogenase-1 operon protein HyaE [Bradyrhizobium macuxiense]